MEINMHTSTFLRWQAFALLAALVLFWPDPSRASTAWFQGDRSRPEVFVFGDSLSDPGNFFVYTGMVSVAPYDVIPSAPYDTLGRQFSNGPTWAQAFAVRLGSLKSALPAFQNPVKFNNFAFGGARARAGGQVPGAAEQLGLFLQAHGNTAPAEALYVVQFGGNDVRDALEAASSNPAAVPQIITEAIAATATTIQSLAMAGGRRFLVANVPDLGHAPAIRMLGPAAVSGARNIASLYNGYLEGALQQLDIALGPLGADIARLDLFEFINSVVAQPESYGLSNVTDPCLTFFVLVDPVCENPNEYLFWDGIHPTWAAHRQLAKTAVRVIKTGAQ
jgi:outer membrane lipase/esterase